MQDLAWITNKLQILQERSRPNLGSLGSLGNRGAGLLHTESSRSTLGGDHAGRKKYSKYLVLPYGTGGRGMLRSTTPFLDSLNGPPTIYSQCTHFTEYDIHKNPLPVDCFIERPYLHPPYFSSSADHLLSNRKIRVPRWELFRV